MAKPIRALELHYPMIQFLKIRDNTAPLAHAPQDSYRERTVTER